MFYPFLTSHNAVSYDIFLSDVAELTLLWYLLVCGNRLVNGGVPGLEATCNMGCSGASTYVYILSTFIQLLDANPLLYFLDE